MSNRNAWTGCSRRRIKRRLPLVVTVCTILVAVRPSVRAQTDVIENLGAGVRLEMKAVPGGRCTVGLPKGFPHPSQPATTVTLPAFLIGRYEITIEQYVRFLEETGMEEGVDWGAESCPLLRHEGGYILSRSPFGQSKRQPMVCVSWFGAEAFCGWLSRRSGRTYALPTEAQWEYAARTGISGGEETFTNPTVLGKGHEGVFGLRPSGRPESPSRATVKVGNYRPNRWGLCDMQGNAWEWCHSLHRAYPYSRDDGRNEMGPLGARVVRGGGWRGNAETWPWDRWSQESWTMAPDIGFRVVSKGDGGAELVLGAPGAWRERNGTLSKPNPVAQ